MAAPEGANETSGIKSDQAVGIAVAVFGISLAMWTSQVDILDNQPTLSARFYPYLLAAIFIMTGLFLAVRPVETYLRDTIRKLLSVNAILFASLFLLYALTFRYVDFRVGTWGFMFISMWILGSRNWIELMGLPLFVSAGIYSLFRYGFTVMVPTWI